jgi:ABC-type proline/glycine betaine transport system permease subunit
MQEAGPEGGPSTEYILHNGARAMHVTGDILKGISDQGPASRVGTWLSRLGAWFTALIEAAIPGTLRHALLGHFWVLVAMLATILIVVSLVFSPLRTLLGPAIFIFALLVGLALVIFVLGLVMKTWQPVLRRLGMVLAAVVIVLILGIFALGLRDAYCMVENLKKGDQPVSQCSSVEEMP